MTLRQARVLVGGVLVLLAGACAPREEPVAETAPETAPAPAAPEAAPDAALEAGAAVASAILEPATPDPDFSGTVAFEEAPGGIRVTVHLAGVDRDGRLGFHVHETGECAHDDAGDAHFTSAGGHFNPAGASHACPPTDPRHAGDLGNIEVSGGTGHLEIVTPLLALEGPASVVGRAVILHAGEDDCVTQPTGNAGARLACGVVTAGAPPATAESPSEEGPALH